MPIFWQRLLSFRFLRKYFGRTPNTQSKTDDSDYNALPPDAAATSEKIGIVRITIQALNIKDITHNPRPFVRFRIQGAQDTPELGEPEDRLLSTKASRWLLNTSRDVFVHSLQESLEFEVLNYHRVGNHGSLGHATLPLGFLEHDPHNIGEEVTVWKRGVASGTMLLNVFYYPVIDPSGSDENGLSRTGIVTLRVHEAKGFGWETYSRKAEALSVVLRLEWSGPPIHETGPSYFVEPAFWKSTFEFLCSDKSSTTVIAKLVDFNEKSTVFGHLSLSLDELLMAQADGQEWWPLSGSRDGQLRMSVEWQSLKMA